MLLSLRDVTEREMKVGHQRKRVRVYPVELVARGRLVGGLPSSTVIEEFGTILVGYLHDAIDFAGMVPSLGLFLSLPSRISFFLSAPRFAHMFWSVRSQFSLFSLHKFNS
jgi:hypothetical protein